MRPLWGSDMYHLNVENPVQHMQTLKVLVFEAGAGPTPEETRSWAERALPGVTPLRWRLAMAPWRLGAPVWLDRPLENLHLHLHTVTLDAPGGREELGRLCGAILARQLDRSRPLWELTHVTGLAGGRVAHIWKIHHAVADGGSTVEILNQVYQHAPEERADQATWPTTDPPPQPADLVRNAVRRHTERFTAFPSVVTRFAKASAASQRTRKSGLEHPARAFSAPMTRWNRAFTPSRSCAAVTLALADMTVVRRAFGVTLNDVLLAVASGALRTHLDKAGELPTASLTAAVPVSIRTEAEQGLYGNRLGQWNVRLASDIADPEQRLQAVHASTQATRRWSQTAQTLRLMTEWQDYTLIFTPMMAFGHLTAHLAAKPPYNLIVSNVRGPSTLYADGHRITELQSFGQLATGLGLNITAWSYGDVMSVGVVACSEHEPDITGLADGLADALAELVALAGQQAQPAR